MQTTTTKTPDLDSIILKNGAHHRREDGVCAMELVAWIAGEPHSDHPKCACPALTSFCIAWNDSLNDEDRNRILKPILPRLVGTRGSKKLAERRAYLAIDWYIRVQLPAWLDLAGLENEAMQVRALPELRDLKGLRSIETVLASVRDRAYAAWSAARSAAESAARSAAWSAARSAARSAAGKILAPTVAELQASALQLLERMIELREEE